MRLIFQIATTVVSLYTMLCFVRIIITWFPGINYSNIGRFLSTICDPYMNLFSRLPLRIGGLDFSPMISIGLLSLLSSVLENITATGRIYFGGILVSLLSLVWSVCSSLLSIFLLALIIRYLVLIFSKRKYNSIWDHFDSALSPIIFKITKIFTKGKSINYKTALGLSIFESVVFLISGQILLQVLINLLVKLPF